MYEELDEELQQRFTEFLAERGVNEQVIGGGGGWAARPRPRAASGGLAAAAWAARVRSELPPLVLPASCQTAAPRPSCLAEPPLRTPQLGEYLLRLVHDKEQRWAQGGRGRGGREGVPQGGGAAAAAAAAACTCTCACHSLLSCPPPLPPPTPSAFPATSEYMGWLERVQKFLQK